MNAAAISDFGSSAMNAVLRLLAMTALAAGAALAIVFAFAAALVVAVMVGAAALALRWWPQARRTSKASSAPEILEARRTPAGWVVEGAMRAK